MNKIIKNGIQVCVAGVALLTAITGLCGCGNTKTNEGKREDTYRYTPVEFDNMNEYTTVVASCFVNESLYYMSVDYEDVEKAASEEEMLEWEDTGEVWQYNCNTGEESMLFKVENASEAEAMTVDENGFVSIVVNDTLAKYSMEGNEILKKNYLFFLS